MVILLAIKLFEKYKGSTPCEIGQQCVLKSLRSCGYYLEIPQLIYLIDFPVTALIPSS